MTAGTVDDLVLLHPSYSPAFWPSDWTKTPLEYAARYVRTSGQSRWHRPRYGHLFQRPGQPDRRVVTLWCGQAVNDLAAARQAGGVPQGEEACGTCEGRALGAGQDETPSGMPPLVFSGRYGAPPSTCPGSRSDSLALPMESWRVATCRACLLVVPMRASGSPYRSHWGMATHSPGEHLVPPCPEHGWHHLRPYGDTGARCVCGRTW